MSGVSVWTVAGGVVIGGVVLYVLHIVADALATVWRERRS